MSKFNYKVNGDAKRGGLNTKPGVWFCCYPMDFEEYFEPLSEDILIHHNCVIFYDSEPDADFEEKELLNCLSDMRMFVIPVTREFLNLEHNCRARDLELRFALEKRIHVLPVIMEPDIDKEYEKVFGKMHFLRWDFVNSPVTFQEMLDSDLDRVLVGSDTREKILSEFKGQIFMSYRRKDGDEAKELMRRIHVKDYFRDIAIWYDKYLVLGENFDEEIKENLQASNLFAITVTPNLLEKPNYIMEKEYPEAYLKGKPILPFEMVSLTDKQHNQLEEDYDKIPPCVDADNEQALVKALKDLLGDCTLESESEEHPAHLFYIGMAYLNGICVEVDHVRAMELISRAAEAELPEAMEQIVRMYWLGDGGEIDYYKCIYWEKQLIKYYKGKINPDFSSRINLCDHLNSLACFQMFIDQQTDSLNTFEEAKIEIAKLKRDNLNPKEKEDLANLLIEINDNLGMTLLSVQQIENAINVLDEAEELNRQLEELNPEEYEKRLIRNNSFRLMVIIKQIQNDFAAIGKSEGMNSEFFALENRIKAGEDIGREALQRARNLPGEYGKEDFLISAILALAKILELRQSLLKSGFYPSNEDYKEKSDDGEIENLYKEALKICKRLMQYRPDRYRWAEANIQNSLDHYYLMSEEYDKIQGEKLKAEDPFRKGMQFSSSQKFEIKPFTSGVDSYNSYIKYLQSDLQELQMYLDHLDDFRGDDDVRHKLLDRALQCCPKLQQETEMAWMPLMHRLANHLWLQDRHKNSVEMDCNMLFCYHPYDSWGDPPFLEVLNISLEAMRRICAYDRGKYLYETESILLTIANKAQEFGEFEQAEEIYRELITAECDGIKLWGDVTYWANRRLANQKIQEKEFEEALPLLHRAVKLGPEAVEEYSGKIDNFFKDYMEIARLQIELHCIDDASKTYRDMLHVFETYTGYSLINEKIIYTACRSLANILIEENKMKEAVDVFLHEVDYINKGIKNYGYNTLVYKMGVDAAEILSDMGCLEEAEHLLAEAMEYWLSMSINDERMDSEEMRRCYRNLAKLLRYRGEESKVNKLNNSIKLQLSGNAPAEQDEEDFNENWEKFVSNFQYNNTIGEGIYYVDYYWFGVSDEYGRYESGGCPHQTFDTLAEVKEFIENTRIIAKPEIYFDVFVETEEEHVKIFSCEFHK